MIRREVLHWVMGIALVAICGGQAGAQPERSSPLQGVVGVYVYSFFDGRRGYTPCGYEMADVDLSGVDEILARAGMAKLGPQVQTLKFTVRDVEYPDTVTGVCLLEVTVALIEKAVLVRPQSPPLPEESGVNVFDEGWVWSRETIRLVSRSDFAAAAANEAEALARQFVAEVAAANPTVMPARPAAAMAAFSVVRSRGRHASADATVLGRGPRTPSRSRGGR
jgi:hypothetical protein